MTDPVKEILPYTAITERDKAERANSIETKTWDNSYFETPVTLEKFREEKCSENCRLSWECDKTCMK